MKKRFGVFILSILLLVGSGLTNKANAAKNKAGNWFDNPSSPPFQRDFFLSTEFNINDKKDLVRKGFLHPDDLDPKEKEEVMKPDEKGEVIYGSERPEIALTEAEVRELIESYKADSVQTPEVTDEDTTNEKEITYHEAEDGLEKLDKPAKKETSEIKQDEETPKETEDEEKKYSFKFILAIIFIALTLTGIAVMVIGNYKARKNEQAEDNTVQPSAFDTMEDDINKTDNKVEFDYEEYLRKDD